MKTIVALIMTVVIAGQVYQEIPVTFYSAEDCENYKLENELPEIFQCVEIKE